MNSTSPDPGLPETATPGTSAPGIFPSEPEERLAAARKKLLGALERLEQAISLHKERALDLADQSAEFSAMQEDRSRLAQELDAATIRLRALEAAAGEASQRVERASAAIRAVLAADLSAGFQDDPSCDSPSDSSADSERED